MKYTAEIAAGALKVPESRVIADLLLRAVDEQGWEKALYGQNALQARSAATARRIRTLIQGRLETMGPELWTLVRDGLGTTATHACLAAAVKHSRLLGDFLDIVVREQYRLFEPSLSYQLWGDYLDDCRNRVPDTPQWADSTIRRMRSSVYQILAQAGYIDNTRTRTFQTVHIDRKVLAYLESHDERYVLKCIQVGP